MEFIELNRSDLDFSDSFLQDINDQIKDKGQAQVSIEDMQQAYLRYQTSIYSQLLLSKNGFDIGTFRITTSTKIFKLVLARALGDGISGIIRDSMNQQYKIW